MKAMYLSIAAVVEGNNNLSPLLLLLLKRSQYAAGHPLLWLLEQILPFFFTDLVCRVAFCFFFFFFLPHSTQRSTLFCTFFYLITEAQSALLMHLALDYRGSILELDGSVSVLHGETLGFFS